MAFLLPLISSIASVAAPIVAAKSAIETVAPHFFGGGYAAPIPGGGGPYQALDAGPAGPTYSDGMVTPASVFTPYGGATGMSAAISSLQGGALATIPKTLLQWLRRFAIVYGPAVADAVWQEFQKRRRAGQTTALAKAAIEDAYPDIKRVRVYKGRRRRMNPTNIRALRRATRRIRSFKRVTRKVRGLGLFGVRRHARPRRRGDLWDIEDLADMEDEAEDLGLPFDQEDLTALAE